MCFKFNIFAVILDTEHLVLLRSENEELIAKKKNTIQEYFGAKVIEPDYLPLQLRTFFISDKLSITFFCLLIPWVVEI